MILPEMAVSQLIHFAHARRIGDDDRRIYASHRRSVACVLIDPFQNLLYLRTALCTDQLQSAVPATQHGQAAGLADPSEVDSEKNHYSSDVSASTLEE